MLVGVGLDQAGINSKAFTTDQVGRNAGPNDTLKHAPEDSTVAKSLVACT